MSENDTTLYRKYRPQKLEEVSGQEHVLAVLKNAITENRVAHAYLFSGPRGTGKTTIARILAKRLNCQEPNQTEPCGKCAQCVAHANRSNLDLIEIDAASNRGIDEIRALKDRIGLAPAVGKYKVYIIDEVHMLTKEAFNALLKTLEEPPSHAIFILATTELHKVPETIKSRCQTFLFKRASVEQLMERLNKISKEEQIEIDEAALRLIAHHSEGCFRDAESLLGQVLSLKTNKISSEDVETLLGVTGFESVQQFISNLLKKDAKNSLLIINNVVEKGASVKRFAEDATRYLRALASFSAAGTHSEAFDSKTEETLQAQAKSQKTDVFVKLLRLLLRAKSEMRDAAYEELPLELAILEWCDDAQPQSSVQQNTQSATPPETKIAAKKEEPALSFSQRIAQRNSAAEISPVVNEAVNTELFEKVKSSWREFIDRTIKLNPLLLSTMEACKPSTAKGNMLYLITDYSLYKERVMDNRVRAPLENLLGEIVKEKILLRVVSTTEAVTLGLPEPQPIAAEKVEVKEAIAETKSTTDEALSILGGELVAQG